MMTGMREDVERTWPEGQSAVVVGPDQFERVAQTASRLANTAHTIPEAVPESALAGRDRQAFLRMVAQLESHARGLQARATAHDEAGMDAALSQIHATCTACHARFREVAGPLTRGG